MFKGEAQVCVLHSEGHVVLPLDGNVEGVDVDLGVGSAIVLGVAKVWLLEVVLKLVLVGLGLESVQVEMDGGGLSSLGGSECVLV